MIITQMTNFRSVKDNNKSIFRKWSSLIYNTSDTSATRATLMWHEGHKCDTSATRTTQVRHELLILITTRVKIYFHIPIFTMWQAKDYKGRNNFVLSTTIRNTSLPCQNEFEKCTTKICNGKSYIKKLYTKL